jgi:hydroxymethylpyrimidine/phosphomethylpyrimidine kinase
MAPFIVLFASFTDNTSGLSADEKAVRAKEFPVTIVSTGSAVRDEENIVDIVEATPSALQNQIDDHVQNADVKAVKIG